MACTDLFFLDMNAALQQAQKQNQVQDAGGARLQYCYYEGELTDSMLENFIRVRQDEFVEFFANNQLPVPEWLIDQQGNEIDIKSQMPDVFDEINRFRATLQIKDYIHQDTDFFNAFEALNTAKQKNRVCCGASLDGLQICYHHDKRFEKTNLENLVYVDIENMLPFFVHTRFRIPKQLEADPALLNDYQEILQAAIQSRVEIAQDLKRQFLDLSPDYTHTPLRVFILAGRFVYSENDDLQESMSASLSETLQRSGFDVLLYQEHSSMETFNEVDFLQHYQNFRPHILIQFNQLYNDFLPKDAINIVFWDGATEQLTQANSLPFRPNDFNYTDSSTAAQHLRRCGAKNVFPVSVDSFPVLYCALAEDENIQTVKIHDKLILKTEYPEEFIQRFQDNLVILWQEHEDLYHSLMSWQEAHQLEVVIDKEIDGIYYDIQLTLDQQHAFSLNNQLLLKNRELINSNDPSAPLLLVEMGAGYELAWIWHQTHQYFIDCLDMQIPVYLVMQDIAQCLLACLLQDFRHVFSCNRLRLFYGEEALSQLFNELIEPYMPLPGQILAASAKNGEYYKSVVNTVQDINRQRNEKYRADKEDVEKYYAAITPQQWLERFRDDHDRPLRVLGITSRFTTFLQYCMRDWLQGFARTGATTACYIESQNYQRGCMQQLLARINAFKPDLILNIDHFRHELPGIPENIPYVNWIQDRLPNISENSKAMELYDFTYVFARDWLSMNTLPEYQRNPVAFLPIGVNEDLYKPLYTEQYDCDVLFITHLVEPDLTFEPIREPEIVQMRWTQKELKVINQGLIDKNTLLQLYRQIERYVSDLNMQDYNIFCFSDPAKSLELLKSQFTELASYDQAVLDLIPATVGNRFHYEALTRLKQWPINILIQEMPDLNLHLYGNNWPRYQQFTSFWQGVAENGEHLNQLMNRARICLNASPGSTMHMRAVETIAAGTFMLTRKITADSSSIWDFFNEDEIIGFSDSKELIEKVNYFLMHDKERQQIAEKARKRVLEQFSYAAISRKIKQDVRRRLEG